MENVTAAFHSRNDMEQASEALRQQGAIDIKLDYPAEFSIESGYPLEAAVMTKSAAVGTNLCTMHVVMESSRVNLAQDIIARYGGTIA